MSNDRRPAHVLLHELLCIALGVGLVLVALVPAARGMSALGWLPMWLLAMPATAWCALRWASPLPALRDVRARPVAPAMKLAPARPGVQARRLRAAAARRGTVRHAA